MIHADVLLLGAVALAVLALLGLEVWALLRWRGGWRLAAAIPLLVVGAWSARIAFDVTSDPTSHNLWPLEIGMWCLGALVGMVVLAVAHAFAPRSREA